MGKAVRAFTFTIQPPASCCIAPLARYWPTVPMANGWQLWNLMSIPYYFLTRARMSRAADSRATEVWSTKLLLVPMVAILPHAARIALCAYGISRTALARNCMDILTKCLRWLFTPTASASHQGDTTWRFGFGMWKMAKW